MPRLLKSPLKIATCSSLRDDPALRAVLSAASTVHKAAGE